MRPSLSKDVMKSLKEREFFGVATERNLALRLWGMNVMIRKKINKKESLRLAKHYDS